jgi:hypothetical protein
MVHSVDSTLNQRRHVAIGRLRPTILPRNLLAGTIIQSDDQRFRLWLSGGQYGHLR